jgi:hypothetical protein
LKICRGQSCSTSEEAISEETLQSLVSRHVGKMVH